MELTLRLAEPHDVERIAEFNALMAEETEGKVLNRETLLKGVAAVVADPHKGLYYVAEFEGRMVGQLMITYEWSDWRNGTFWWIQSVYVDVGARGSGVFRALFDHVRSLATSRKDVCGFRLYVERSNERAKRTYDRHGMHASHYEMFEMDINFSHEHAPPAGG